MHFCMSAGGRVKRRPNEEGPLRAPLRSAESWGKALEADGGREGRSDRRAQRQDEGGRYTVEKPFKTSERHDTHLLSWNPGGAGPYCYVSTVKIGHI